MRNIKKYLSNINTVLISAITVDSYIRLMNKDSMTKETDRIVKETVRKSVELSDKLNDKMEQTMSNNIEIQANLGRIKESLEQIETNAKVLS